MVSLFERLRLEGMTGHRGVPGTKCCADIADLIYKAKLNQQMAQTPEESSQAFEDFLQACVLEDE